MLRLLLLEADAASPANAVVDTGVAATVIRAYAVDEIRTSSGDNYHFLESAIMKEGIKQTGSLGHVEGSALTITTASNPTTPCGGGYGFRAQSYGYTIAYGGTRYEKYQYSGLVRTACT